MLFRSVNALMFDPEDAEVLYAGANTGIYVSVDQGQSWWQYNEGLLNHPIIYSLAVQKQTATMYATTPYGLFKMEKN